MKKKFTYVYDSVSDFSNFNRNTLERKETIDAPKTENDTIL